MDGLESPFVEEDRLKLHVIEEEKVSSCGKMFANIKIGQEELNQFINLKGFELCRDNDIIFKSIKG